MSISSSSSSTSSVPVYGSFTVRLFCVISSVLFEVIDVLQIRNGIYMLEMTTFLLQHHNSYTKTVFFVIILIPWIYLQIEQTKNSETLDYSFRKL